MQLSVTLQLSGATNGLCLCLNFSAEMWVLVASEKKKRGGGEAFVVFQREQILGLLINKREML